MMMYVFLLNRSIFLFKYLFFFKLNTHEFRSVLPAVALSINRDPSKPNGSKWNQYARAHPGIALYILAVLIGVTAFILGGMLIIVSFIFNYFFLIFILLLN